MTVLPFVNQRKELVFDFPQPEPAPVSAPTRWVALADWMHEAIVACPDPKSGRGRDCADCRERAVGVLEFLDKFDAKVAAGVNGLAPGAEATSGEARLGALLTPSGHPAREIDFAIPMDSPTARLRVARELVEMLAEVTR